MEYGNTPRVISRVALIGLFLGMAAAVVAVVGGLIAGNLAWHRAHYIVLIIFVSPAILVLAVAPTVCFRIRIADGRVQHLFLGRYVLSDYPLQDFLCIQRFERGCAAVLHFRDGGRIHFLGAHWGEISRLARDLSETQNETITAS